MFTHAGSRIVLLVLVGGLLLSATPSMGSIVVGDRMYFGDWNTSLNGGPFTAYAINPSTFASFTTFCALSEGTLYVNGGAGYRYEVTNVGLAGTNPSYALAEHTAWLYSSFMTGSLSGYVNNKAHNDALQYGVWNSMGQTDAILQADGNFNANAKAAYLTYGWNQTPASWTGYGNVKIAQLRYLNNTTPAQDILFEDVPEPTTMSLLALGGLAMLRRRKK